MKFETRRLKSKSKTLNSMVTKFLRYLTPANIDTCWYWHLSSFRSQFWTKNAKFSNFEEIWYLDKPRVVNSMVTIFFCGSWRLSIFKIFNIGTCYFLSHTFQPKTAPVFLLFYFTHTKRWWWIQWFWYWEMQVDAAEN